MRGAGKRVWARRQAIYRKTVKGGPMARKKNAGTIPIENVKHKDKRVNIPTEELRDFVAEYEAKPKTVFYPRDPSLDPQCSEHRRVGNRERRQHIVNAYRRAQATCGAI